MRKPRLAKTGLKADLAGPSNRWGTAAPVPPSPEEPVRRPVDTLAHSTVCVNMLGPPPQQASPAPCQDKPQQFIPQDPSSTSSCSILHRTFANMEKKMK